MRRSDLIRVRNLFPVSRRDILRGAAAFGTLAGAGMLPLGVGAATKVSFVGWQGYDTGLSVDSYMKDNDIELETTYIGNNDEIVTKLQSGGIGTIDIVTPYMGYIPLLALAGLIDPIDESLVPNLEQVLPLFRDDANINVDGKLYGVPFTWGSAPMMYDPALIPEAPESWQVLLDPQYKGKVGMMDDPLGNVMLAAVIATDAQSATMLTHDQLKASVDFLLQVKAQSRLLAVSWGDLADAMARGEVAITFSGWETIKKFAADKGKAIEYTYPKEGTFAWLDNFCVAKDAPNREAAHALANLIIDVPAQNKIGTEDLQGIVNKQAIAKLDPASRGLYPYDDLENLGAKATFFAFPPLEADGQHATFEEWLKEYERFKTA